MNIKPSTGAFHTAIECGLTDDTFGFPARGLWYVVREGASARTLQWGQTDRDGAFRISLSDKLNGVLRVECFDAAGGPLAHASVDPRARHHVFTVPFPSWRTYERGRRPVATASSHVGTYRGMVDRLSRSADAKGVSIGKAAGRCLQAAYELDELTRAADRVLGWEPGAFDELAVLLHRRPRLHPTRGEPTSRTPAPRPTSPSFGPGMAELFARVLRIGTRHRGLGVSLLDALFDLNRSVAPVVRLSRRPNHGPRAGRNGLGVEGGPPDDADVPLGLTDPYFTDPADWSEPQPEPGRPGWPTEPLTPEDRVLIRCEHALSGAFDQAAPPARAVRGGGSTHGLSIRAIAPNHEPQQGNRTIRISVVSRSHELVEGTTTVPVLFPVRGGRKEVSGVVVATSQLDGNDWLHEIDVVAPVRTNEGLVQVCGLPPECANTAPASDPVVDQLLGAVDACMGTKHTPVVWDATPSCAAVPPNWAGGCPEIHFRWVEPSGARVDGDGWFCHGGGSAYHQRRTDDVTPSAPSDRVIRVGNTEAMVDWMRVRAIGATADDEGCRLQHESVVLHLEADQGLDVEYLTTNDPTVPTHFRLSPPLLPALAGPASHVIAGTAYHVKWDDEQVVAEADWIDLGIGSVQGAYAPLEISWAGELGVIPEPRLQLLRADASNALPGHGSRVLEIARAVRPARIESIHVTPVDASNETVNVQLVVGMPTFAALGVSVTIEVKVGDGSPSTFTRTYASKDSIVHEFSDIPYQEHAQRGSATVSAAVKYHYVSGGVVGPFVEIDGEGKSVSVTLPPKGLDCVRHTFAPRAAGHNWANAYLLALASLNAYVCDNAAEERKRQRMLGSVLGFDSVAQLDTAAFVFGTAYPDTPIVVDSQAVVLRNSRLALIAFRGTQTAVDWAADCFSPQVPVWDFGPYPALVHSGFLSALNVMYDDIKNQLPNPIDVPVWITGHSLGGALAVLCAYRLLGDGIPVQGVYTYGCPRVGNPDFQGMIDGALADRPIQQWVDDFDIAPGLPPTITPGFFFYNHLGQMNHIKKRNGQILFELDSDDSVAANVSVHDHQISRYSRRLFNRLDASIQYQVPDPPAHDGMPGSDVA